MKVYSWLLGDYLKSLISEIGKKESQTEVSKYFFTKKRKKPKENI